MRGSLLTAIVLSSGIAAAVLLAACSQNESPFAGGPGTSATPPGGYVDLDEAEAALGMRLVTPSYIPEGLGSTALAQLLPGDNDLVTVGLTYGADGSVPDMERTVDTLFLLQGDESSMSDMGGRQPIRIGGQEAFVIEQSGRTTSVVDVVWLEGDRAFEVTIHGNQGVSLEAVREEAVMVVESMMVESNAAAV